MSDETKTTIVNLVSRNKLRLALALGWAYVLLPKIAGAAALFL